MYNITKGQLITIWVFGLFLWVVTFFCGLYSYSSIFDKIWLFLFLVIPFIVVFYTIWLAKLPKTFFKAQRKGKGKGKGKNKVAFC